MTVKLSMKITLAIPLLSVWMAVASPVFAEEAGGVDAFVADVMARNPTLRARTLVRDAAGQDRRAEGLCPIPKRR